MIHTKTGCGAAGRRNNMKKLISAAVSAAMAAASLTSATVYAEQGKTAAANKSGIVLLGDSIAAGDLRSGKVEHNYGEICGDYLGCKVYNYAVTGYDTEDVISTVEGFTADQKKAVAGAEAVVISVGGNDIMNSLAKYILDYAGSKTSEKFLKDGYSKDDIPEKPSLGDLTKMLNVRDEGGLMDYMSKGGMTAQREVADEIGSAFSSITSKDGTLNKQTIPNLKKAVEEIKAISPDTRILVQNLYQPIQLEPSYVAKAYGSQSDYASFLSIIRLRCENMMSAYNDRISAIDGIEVVDVKSQFTSLEKTPSTSNPGNANYFVDIQTGSLATADVHPNQKGHIAIAAAVLDKIGRLHKDNGLLSQTFNGLGDKDKYPAIALETYNKVAGVEPVTTTTTTTSKTTTTTTTTSKTTTTTTTTQPVKKYALGDVDGNGDINAVDASKVLAEYAKTSSGDGKGDFDAEQTKAADVDSNGDVNSVDASKILAYYAYCGQSDVEPKTLSEFLKTL